MTRNRTTRTTASALLCLAATAFGSLAADSPGPAPAAVRLPGFHKGITLGGAHWRKDEYQNLDWTLDKAVEHGASHVLVIPAGFLYPGKTGNEIRKVFFHDPVYSTNPRFQSKQWGWWGASLTDHQLHEIARGVSDRGMKLVLKPHIDPWDGTSRGAAIPSDPGTFFANYTAFIEHYASLAEELDAVLFVIGTEMSNIASTRGALANMGVDVTAEWKNIIRRVREVYTGRITYSSSAFGDWKTWNPADIGKGPSLIGFWDALDCIGFEPYFGVTRKSDPTRDELTRGFMEKFDLYARPLAERYGKKIILTEVNAYAFDSMNTDPISMFTTPENHPLDHREQADYYDSLFTAILERPYIEGTYIWPFFLRPRAPEKDEDYFEMQSRSHRDSLLGVPAGEVLRKWYQAIDGSNESAD